jgi:hypothetical protein
MNMKRLIKELNAWHDEEASEANLKKAEMLGFAVQMLSSQSGMIDAQQKELETLRRLDHKNEVSKPPHA